MRISMLRDATNLLLALLIGIIGGALCGAIILTISLYKPTHELLWSTSVLYWGLLYGAIIGGLGVPAAHLLLLRKIGFRKAFFPALVGTLVGGIFGSIANPFWAMVSGIVGFSIAVVFVARRKTEALPSSRTCA
jgi:hypothetical protein